MNSSNVLKILSCILFNTCNKRTALTSVKHVGYFQYTVYHDPSQLYKPIKKCLQFNPLTLLHHINMNKRN